MWYGGVLYIRVVYCVLGRCGVSWRCTVCLGSVLCGRALYVAVGRCTELGQCNV